MKNIYCRLVLGLAFSILAAMPVSMQTTTDDDYKKTEFHVGFSSTISGSGKNVYLGENAVAVYENRPTYNGVNASGVYNMSRFFGIKADVSAGFARSNVASKISAGGTIYDIAFRQRGSLFNLAGGVQVKDNSNSGRFKPFAHALAGVAHRRSSIENFSCTSPPGGDCSQYSPAGPKSSATRFSAVIGGGIDLRINNRVQIRAIQVDYLPVNINGWSDNFRLGAGIVF